MATEEQDVSDWAQGNSAICHVICHHFAIVSLARQPMQKSYLRRVDSAAIHLNDDLSTRHVTIACIHTSMHRVTLVIVKKSPLSPVIFIPSLPPFFAADSASAKLLSDVGIGGVALGRKGSTATKSSQGTGSAQNISMCGLLSLEFYRPYFDVDTDQVKARLLQATLPMRQATPFLDQTDAEQPGGAPDLYGPVWVSAGRVRPCFRSSMF